MAPFFEIGQIVTVGFFFFPMIYPLMGALEKVIYIFYSEAALKSLRASMHSYTH